jgi:hypothetical protein
MLFDDTDNTELVVPTEDEEPLVPAVEEEMV